MSISLLQAKKLCTKAEFQIVQASFVKNAKVTAERLKQKIQYAENAKEKYQMLARRQQRSAKKVSDKAHTQTAKRTLLKAQLFIEVSDKFKKQLVELNKVKSKVNKIKSKKVNKKVVSDKKVAAKLKTSSLSKPTGIVARALNKAAQRKKKLNEKKKQKQAKSSVDATKGVQRELGMQRNRSGAIQAHVRASGKRNQARRDSKG